MSAMGHVQRKWSPNNVTLILHGTRCVYTSMNVRKLKCIFYIYTLLAFYGDIVYTFSKIVGRNDFSDQFKKIINCSKRIRYNMNVRRQTACLVVNPITVYNFAALLNCTPAGRASDFMMAPA